jgi:hypothetical protein
MLLNRDLSLFSPQALAKRHNRALLLQFILAELFEAHKAFLTNRSWEFILSCHPRFFPYDWAAPSGFLNKMKEHGLLLKKSFPDHARPVKGFEQLFKKTLSSWEKKKKIPKKQFEKTLQMLYSSLEPLLETCKENENLIYFLLKNRQTIDELMQKGYLRNFLISVHPYGLEILGEKMCDQYHQRGFISQIPELKILMTDLIHV